MDKEDIRRAVCRAIAESTEISERAAWALRDNIQPIKEIESFDSYSGEEATAAIGDLLDYDFPLKINLFIADEGPPRALRIGEVVERIHRLTRSVGSKA